MQHSDKTVEGLIEEKIIDVKDKQLCFCPLCLGMSNNETYFRHMLTEVSAASRRETAKEVFEQMRKFQRTDFDNASVLLSTVDYLMELQKES